MATIRDKQPSADAGRVIVDNQLADLETDISKLYEKTGKEIQDELDSFLAKYKEADKKKQELVKEGKMSEEEYKDWRERQIFRSDAMQAKIDDLSNTMVNADKAAMRMVNGQLPETYATSYNFGIFRGETYANELNLDYTPFTLYNKNAVRILSTQDPDLIPWKPSINKKEDKAWNRSHIQDAVRQGILKGDSMDKIADRLMPVVGMDETAAIRTARTAVNGIENKARHDSADKLIEGGIPMVRTWICTHDSRTRDSHILLDGKHPDDNGYYENGLEYPGDPSGDPAEVYNCRCNELTTMEGIDHSKDKELYDQFMKENYFEDWQSMKEKQSKSHKEEDFQANKAKAEKKRKE